MAALGAESSSGSSNVSARASSAGALRMLYTRHVDTSATISAAKYLLLRPPQAHGERLALLWTQGENGGVHFRSVRWKPPALPTALAGKQLYSRNSWRQEQAFPPRFGEGKLRGGGFAT